MEVATVAMLTVRNVDPHVKLELQRRAAAKGRSMEAEIRDILERVTSEPESELHLAHVLSQAFDGFDLVLPDYDRSQEQPRPVDFG